MPIIDEVIIRVDEIRPNAFDDLFKANIILEIDGKIAREIMDTVPNVTEYPTDGNDSLMVSYPYDRLYDFYLLANIAYAQGDFDIYANDMKMFNSSFDCFIKQYNRNNDIRNQPYLKRRW